MRNILKVVVGVLLTLGGFYLPFQVLVVALLVPTQYASKATITPPNSAYTTIAREIIIIKTPLVLSNVVQELQLGPIFAKRLYEESGISDDLAIAFLKHQITIKEDEKAHLIEVHVLEEDNLLGARIANSIANAYCNLVRSRPGGTKDSASILEEAHPSLHPVTSRKTRILVGFCIGIAMILVGLGLVRSTLKRPTTPPKLPHSPAPPKFNKPY